MTGRRTTAPNRARWNHSALVVRRRLPVPRSALAGAVGSVVLAWVGALFITPESMGPPDRSVFVVGVALLVGALVAELVRLRTAVETGGNEAVLGVELHGPRSARPRRPGRGLWQTTVTLDGEKLPLELVADSRRDEATARRIAADIATRFGVRLQERC